MKNIKLLISVLLLLSIALLPLLESGATAQTKAERKAAVQRTVEERVTNGNFEIEVSRAVPAKGSSIALNADYSLIIRNDSVISRLPYYGRAYSAPMSGAENLMFSTQMEEYTVLRSKKGYTIKFTARTRKEVYKFYVEIGLDGGGSVRVDSNNRQGISFIGELDTEVPEQRDE